MADGGELMFRVAYEVELPKADWLARYNSACSKVDRLDTRRLTGFSVDNRDSKTHWEVWRPARAFKLLGFDVVVEVGSRPHDDVSCLNYYTSMVRIGNLCAMVSPTPIVMLNSVLDYPSAMPGTYITVEFFNPLRRDLLLSLEVTPAGFFAEDR